MKSPSEFALQLSPATCQQLAALWKEDEKTFTTMTGTLFQWIADGMKEKCTSENLPILARAFLANLSESHYARFQAYRIHKKA